MAAAVTACAVAASPAASQTDDPPQHRLTAASHAVVVRARAFTYCRSVGRPDGPGVSMCADGIARPTALRVPVHAGGSIAVTTGVKAVSFTARYGTASGAPALRHLPVRAIDASGKRFRVVLPRARRPSALLLVSITYRDHPGDAGTIESGDAHFAVGLRRHKHARP